MRFLITGHTGFKGSWLSLWLARGGHDVLGVALDPRPGSLFEQARVAEVMDEDVRMDIRDSNELEHVFGRLEPDVVLHLAAQPLVREAYRDPVATISTNVNGTLNVLTAMRNLPTVKAAVIVTTDKVYRNDGRIWGYREIDPLGGEDPYSASKAMADLLTQSWMASYPGIPTAVARAGNVIGGCDVSPERLLPDLLAAYSTGGTPELRYPGAVRPWQHVLDCLNGYLTLIAALVEGRASDAWNFGPDVDSFQTVGQVNDKVARLFGASGEHLLAGDQPHEAALLTLDSRKAQIELGWRNHLGFDRAVEWTVDWHQRVASGMDPREVTMTQIEQFSEILAGQ